MFQRNKNLLPLILAVVVLGAIGFAGYNMFYLPLQDYNNQIADLDKKINRKFDEMNQVRKEQAALERFQHLSLPGDLYQMQQDYQRYLNELVNKHNFKVKEVSYKGSAVTKSGKSKNLMNKKSDPIYTGLLFKVDAEASLKDLALMLKEFNETPLLHKIKTMTLKPKDAASKEKEKFRVLVEMDVEAVMVEGVTNRPETLVGADERLTALTVLISMHKGPGMLALVPWMVGHTGPVTQAKLAKERGLRDPLHIAKGNVFVGYLPPIVVKKDSVKPPPPPPPGPSEEPEDPLDMREFYKLSIITKSEEGDEATLYSPANDHFIRLRNSPAFKYFAINSLDKKVTQMKGEVIRIDFGRVYFKSGGEYFCIKSGDSVYEAMRKTVPQSELKEMGILVTKESSGTKEIKGTKDTKGTKDFQGIQDFRNFKELFSPQTSIGSKESKSTRNTKEIKTPQTNTGTKEIRGTQDTQKIKTPLTNIGVPK